jgi:serine/threonine-protein kinase
LANYIELFDAGRPLGRHSLPEILQGTNGESFRLKSVAGGGGNGVVFRATPLGSLRNDIDDCAVKMLRQQDAARIDRFENEARIMELLDHERIAQLFARGTLPITKSVTVPWIAMELGEANLRAHVLQHGPLPLARLKTVALQMCDAISHLHERSIIHRDLKPDNFVWDGERPDAIKMIDFGIAKLRSEDVSGRPLDQFTKQLEFVGPVFFSSPELIAYAQDKTHPVDQRSDLFQLGKTIWFLACGRVSAGIPAKRLCPADGAIHDVVRRLLHDDPDDRLQSAANVRSYLEVIPA